MILSRGKLFFALLIASLVLQPALVWASPALQEKRGQADRIAKEINAMNDSNEVAVEQYNQAQLKLNQVRQQLTETRGKLAKAEADLDKSQNTLNSRAAGIYKGGETIGILEVMLSARNMGDFLNAVQSIQQVSKHDAKLLKRIKKYRIQVEKAGKALAKQEKAQTATTAVLHAKKNEIQKQLSARENTLKKLKAEIAKTEHDEAAATARLASYTRARSVKTKITIPSTNVPASGRGGAAVQLAMQQLGKPYVWAAAGPNSFDCSGLTMYVYAQLGVSLPHSAQAQYGCGPKISRDQLQPGDLIFGGSGGYISHVGMYVGGGNYIHAPSTGDVVKISSLASRSNYVGACRP